MLDSTEIRSMVVMTSLKCGFQNRSIQLLTCKRVCCKWSHHPTNPQLMLNKTEQTLRIKNKTVLQILNYYLLKPHNFEKMLRKGFNLCAKQSFWHRVKIELVNRYHSWSVHHFLVKAFQVKLFWANDTYKPKVITWNLQNFGPTGHFVFVNISNITW